MAPAGRYISKHLDHRVSKGNSICQSLISPWSIFVFFKTFPSTLAYVILCTPGFPFLSFISPSFLSPILLLFPLSCVDTIGIGSDQTVVGFCAIGRHIGVALLPSFHPVGLRCDVPVEDLVKIRGVEDAQRALALQPSGTGVPTYTPHPTLVEQFSSQVSTRQRSRAGLFLFTRPSEI